MLTNRRDFLLYSLLTSFFLTFRLFKLCGALVSFQQRNHTLIDLPIDIIPECVRTKGVEWFCVGPWLILILAGSARPAIRKKGWSDTVTHQVTGALAKTVTALTALSIVLPFGFHLGTSKPFLKVRVACPATIASLVHPTLAGDVIVCFRNVPHSSPSSFLLFFLWTSLRERLASTLCFDR